MSDLRAELESLRRENARLRKLLRLTDAEVAPALGTQTAWFDKAPGPVDARSSSQAKVEFYATLFGARRDVYAVRWESARTGKSGWMPAVEGGWRKGRPASEVRHLPLTPDVLAAHLTGDVHIGIYPMLRGDQTCWLAADFDGQAALLDALAYLKAARAVGAPAALEVSRSGIGAHVWIFFTDPVPAATARQLGTALVREAIAIRGRMDLRCYDRLFPSQDVLPGQGPGNLIAAPLLSRPTAVHHCWSSPPDTSSAKASTAPLSTRCSWPARSRSRAASSSTPAASSEPIRVSGPQRCTTTTTSRCQCSRPHSRSAHPATPASASPTPARSESRAAEGAP